MGAPRPQTTAGTPSQSTLPLRVGFWAGWQGRGLAAEPGWLWGGRTLTRGLRARARRGPGDKEAGALLRAQEGGGGKGHSEEPAARAAKHKQQTR